MAFHVVSNFRSNFGKGQLCSTNVNTLIEIKSIGNNALVSSSQSGYVDIERKTQHSKQQANIYTTWMESTN